MAKLKTETDTPEMMERIVAAFLVSDYAAEAEVYDSNITADFEHGQWWVHNAETGAVWSVVDAEGGHAIDGFDFERVSEGDDGG